MDMDAGLVDAACVRFFLTTTCPVSLDLLKIALVMRESRMRPESGKQCPTLIQSVGLVDYQPIGYAFEKHAKQICANHHRYIVFMCFPLAPIWTTGPDRFSRESGGISLPQTNGTTSQSERVAAEVY